MTKNIELTSASSMELSDKEQLSNKISAKQREIRRLTSLVSFHMLEGNHVTAASYCEDILDLEYAVAQVQIKLIEYRREQVRRMVKCINENQTI